MLGSGARRLFCPSVMMRMSDRPALHCARVTTGGSQRMMCCKGWSLQLELSDLKKAGVP